jgi:hypothetical protein
MLKSRIKNVIIVLLTSLTVTIFYILSPRVQADDSSILQQIAATTNSILTQINSLPAALQTLTELALSWMGPDTSTTTANSQANFTAFTTALLQNTQTATNVQAQLLTDFFNPPAVSTMNNDPSSVAYQTLWGPYSNKTTNPPSENNPGYNYLKYASALNITRSPIFMDNKNKNNVSARLYNNYYNTVSAVQTFNGYVLSNLYANYKNGNVLSTSQQQLITQASDGNWLAQIASEYIGTVLRQLLLYNSQTYVLLSQLLQNQQQLLTAQVMTNSLLIAINQPAETQLYNKASG